MITYKRVKCTNQIPFQIKIHLFFFSSLVDSCPKNEQGVIQASKRLGCGNDTQGNNQYLCLPNKSKTSLVEFCFQGLMGIVSKGTLNIRKKKVVLKIIVNIFIT